MRKVAVTEGDEVEAQLQFEYSVNTHGVGDLVKVINQVNDSDIDQLCAVYDEQYNVSETLKKV